MTAKRFTYLNASKNHYIGSFFCNGVPLTNKEVVDLLNENEELKKALFFYLSIAISESSIDYQNDLNKWCNRLFNCNYEEAKRKYGDFEYKERWESE